ncbi:hypothetical protein C9J44_02575 [Photobacterium sp. GB-27]|nr:hypothetical protein C9J40_05360 [Photobacterium sp. GB-72]PSV38704.1 hypothetical protein C9J44_02575 [Photobacterium sp. GB-27]PSV40119.1 hypothetical protein C9J38_06270 [Photobacterium sp. GB-210]
MEYAQEYSKKEKAVRILAGVFVGSVIYFLHTIWLIPIINDVYLVHIALNGWGLISLIIFGI